MHREAVFSPGRQESVATYTYCVDHGRLVDEVWQFRRLLAQVGRDGLLLLEVVSERVEFCVRGNTSGQGIYAHLHQHDRGRMN